MKVAELRAVLEHVPDDLDVVVSSGRGCGHVSEVKRTTTHRNIDKVSRPGVLHIESWRAPLWYEPPCDFKLSGPFRASAELERKLGDLP